MNKTQLFSWTNVDGREFTGEVIDIQNDIAIVKCTDGPVRACRLKEHDLIQLKDTK